MIISYRYRFVYLGPPKTGTRTCFRVLEDVGAVLRPSKAWEPQGWHDPFVPKSYAGYHLLMSVREPVKRMVSLWRHMQRTDGEWERPEFLRCPFPDFVQAVVSDRFKEFCPWYWTTQDEFLGKRTACIIRMDNIENDLRGLPFIDSKVEVLCMNPGPDDIQAVEPTAKTIGIIHNWAHNDYLRFGFDVQC